MSDEPDPVALLAEVDVVLTAAGLAGVVTVLEVDVEFEVGPDVDVVVPATGSASEVKAPGMTGCALRLPLAETPVVAMARPVLDLCRAMTTPALSVETSVTATTTVTARSRHPPSVGP